MTAALSSPGLVLVVAATGLVLFPLSALLISRPQRGLLLLAAMVPFDGLLVLVPDAEVLSPWKEATVLAVFLATWGAPESATRHTRRPLPGWAWAALGLLVLGAASALVVGGVVGVWGLKVGYFYLLVPLILWRCPFDSRERDLLVTVLMSTGAVCAAVGLAQQLVGPDALHAWGYPYNETIRFSGGFMRSFSTFPQPFAFGLFLSMVLLVGLPVALGDVRRPRNCFFLAVSPLIALGMASSVVRGAILGTAVGLLVLLVRRHHGLVHLAAPAAALVLVLPTAVLGAFLSSSSLDERTTGWGGIGTIVLSAPLGNGLGTTGAAAEKSLSSGAGTADVLMMDGERYQPDSQYVKVLLELGPVGLWLFLVLLLAALAAAFDTARSSAGADRALAEGVAASVAGAVAASLVATYLEIFPLDFFFWLFLGVLLCLGPRSTSTPSPSDPRAAASRPTSASSSWRRDH